MQNKRKIKEFHGYQLKFRNLIMMR